MRRAKFVALVCLLALPFVCFADNYIVPTTTLSAQTANNTSAANSFVSQTNGNLGATNISKVDVHSLLYPGAQTKVYAHLLLWFGEASHMNVGYSSTDPKQVASQIADMVSRGIDGVVIDWYGPNNSIDTATKLVMAEAEKHPGFTFAIMIDQGAIEWDSCSGCNAQQALISQMQYIEQTYFPSPAYMTINGQPVVTNFNIDQSYSVDWNAVNSALGAHPAYIFQNNSGFGHTLSDGSYSWVMPTTTDYGMGYLSSFYGTGLSSKSEQTIGGTYKGFNDTLASWGSNRIMKQQCGQTWLETFSEINKLYNSSNPLPYLQLVTWNDYEEATEIESGVDDCFSLSASLNASTLQWQISGDESTIDHYTAYISSDGQNLMELSQTQPGDRSLNLCSFLIPNANYQLFVQAVGKPGLANTITSAVPFNAACAPVTGPSPTLSFVASPLTLNLKAGQSAKVTLIAQAESGAINTPVQLSCGNLPSNLQCSFSPASITPGASSATSVVTISAASASAKNRPAPTGGLFYATAVLPFGLAVFVFIGNMQRGRLKELIAIALLVGVGLMSVSCGGGKLGAMQAAQTSTTGAGSGSGSGSGSSSTATASNYSVTINGNANSVQVATTISVTVQ